MFILATIMKIENYPYVDKYEYIERVIEPLRKYNNEVNIEYLKNNYFTIHNSIAWEDKKFETNLGKFEIFFNDKLYKDYNDDKKLILLTNHMKDSL